MSEQKMAGAIADAVLNTPEPDKWIDCGDSRPLPMFHMATLMQYGERCAEAALAWLRSQGEPMAWASTNDEGDLELIFWDRKEASSFWDEPIPLYIAPPPAVAGKKENHEQQVRSEMDAVGRRQPNQVAVDCFRGDTDMLIACVNALLELDAEGALVPHGIGGHARALLQACVVRLSAQPAIPAGWQPIATAPKDGSEVILLFASADRALGERVPRVRAASWSGDWSIPYYASNPPISWQPMPTATEPTK